MKKLYTFLILVAMSSTLNAQDYIIAPNDTIEETIYINQYVVSTMNFDHDNVTTDSIYLEWDVISIDITASQGLDYSYCDYTSCYDGTQTHGTMTRFGQNQSGFLKVNLLTPTMETSTFRFKVYHTGDEANADTVTFIFNAVLGIEDITVLNPVTLFPNPSNGQDVTVDNLLSNSTVKLSNSLGQTIFSEESMDEQFVFSTANLNEGIYFVSFMKENKVYSVRKLMVR